MRLTSSHNPLIKHVRSLARAAVRREKGEYIAEGVRLLLEAHRSGLTARVTLYDSEVLQRTSDGRLLLADLATWGEEIYEVDAHVMKAAAQTDHPAGALAVLRLPAPLSLSTQQDARFGVILDTLSDPGNAGTIVRTAWAVGADYLVSTPNSVDLFSPKVVRAGMGAHFSLPLFTGIGWNDMVPAWPHTAFVAATAHAEASLFHFVWPERSALIVGSEAHGLSVEASSHVQMRVRIPMQRGVESLNASIAAGILMYAARSSSLSSES